MTAWLIHLYTASGVGFAFLAVAEIASATPDPRLVFLWLIIALIVDATDGPMARRADVKVHLPHIQGRAIDDIVDYLTFTFVPMLLVWRMDWLPEPVGLWITIPLITSLLGFANDEAKDEEDGFFRGFPSYWNIVVFYFGVWSWCGWESLNLAVLLALSAMTVLPVRFIYPNLAPAAWRKFLLNGAYVWLVLLCVMVPFYPRIPPWLMWVSMAYPAAYVLLSFALDPKWRFR